jgi:DNA helicase-2/ATP-dependent DNA helicase PcrA
MQKTEFDYLSGLNEPQMQAALHTTGPSLIIAGAGAGKTRTLTYRIVHLLRNSVPAGKILALTFTNKAAKEMKNRIAGIIGSEISRNLWMGTFHSVFAKILRMEGEKLGYRANFTIYDTADARSLIRSLIRELNLDDNVYKPAAIASRISSAKNDLVTAGMYAANTANAEDDKNRMTPLFADLYKTYAARCFRANAMDFDDLLLNTNILFRDFPETLATYQRRFEYVLVDEYQDTNYSQYVIVKKLAEPQRNICVVGDDAQSIYSFRGARIENILEFKNDYPEYRLFKLEQNYRSTQTLVQAANSIIANNEGQIEKNVYSMNEEGEKIQVLQAMTDSEEGFNIASDILGKKLALRLNWHNFAILYRTNAQSRIFEETLRRKNIPYKIYGGLSFYERKEIKDILAYFRMAINHEDEEALRRSINYPKRGIGDTTVEKIIELARTNSIPGWEVLCNADSYPEHFNAGTVKKLFIYRDIIRGMSTDRATTDAFTKAREIVMGAGIMRELREGKLPEEISRYENMEELLNAVKIFTEDAVTNGDINTLEAYMANVSLLTDQDFDSEEEHNKVTLMTIHASKGLEFPHVYIVGMEDTLFPSLMSTGSAKELEEERRLFYVALTRAEKQATLSYAFERYKWGKKFASTPSRFIREVDRKFLSYPQANNRPFEAIAGNTVRKTYTAREEPRSYMREDKPKIFIANKVPQTNFSMNESVTIAEGDSVYHERFGAGQVLSIEGAAPNTTASVRFADGSVRKLLLRFAKLMKTD